VIKPDNDERRLAMFKDNKLRLLMTLVGFSRLGEAHDPDATWIVPSTLSSEQLQEAIDLIRKYEFDPPTYEDGKQPEDLLRSKTSAARRSTRRVDFDDDDDNDDGIDNVEEEDHGEYAADAPTARKPDGPRKKLKRRERVKTPVELDDEEKDRRAEARRKKELEKLAKEKSTMYVHDSDDEEDAERDAEFFAREETLRQEMMKAFGKSLVLGITEPAVSKKRKAEEVTPTSKRRKTPPKRKAQPFADSDDDTEEDVPDAESPGSRGPPTETRDVLENESEDEAMDTPLSSQHADGVHESDEDTVTRPAASSAAKSQDLTMADTDDDDDDEDEDVPVVRRPMARNTRAGFIIDSDSE
jgi:replication fork protection complex subunit Tof1/Swi1